VRRPALRTTTGLTLTTVGAILLLAVRVHTAFLDLQTTGLILLAAGLAWLWIPVAGKRVLLTRQLDRAMAYLDADPGRLASSRVSLTELLDEPQATGERHH
jgi:hypothetical protein